MVKREHIPSQDFKYSRFSWAELFSDCVSFCVYNLKTFLWESEVASILYQQELFHTLLLLAGKSQQKSCAAELGTIFLLALFPLKTETLRVCQSNYPLLEDLGIQMRAFSLLNVLQDNENANVENFKVVVIEVSWDVV